MTREPPTQDVQRRSTARSARGGPDGGSAGRGRPPGARLAAALAAAAVSLTVASAPATAEDVRWAITLTAPNYFPTATGRAGIAQLLLSYVAPRMPDRRFVAEDMPFNRFINLVRNDEPICQVFMIRTAERAGFMAFTRTEYLALGNRLFVSRDLADRVPVRDGVADIASAVRGGLRMAVVRGRSHGADVDREIDRVRDRLVEVGEHQQVLRLHEAGRIDMFVALPHETMYWNREHAGRGGNPWRSFAVPGPSVLAVPVAACPDTDWGEAMVAQVDAALDDEILARSYRDYMRWLDPDSIAHLAEKLEAAGIAAPLPAEDS